MALSTSILEGFAQMTSIGGPSATNATNGTAANTNYSVVARGRDYRVMEWRELQTNELGKVSTIVHRYDELQSGLHRNVAGVWNETSESLEILPAGGAGTTNLNYGVYLPGNLVDDAFQVTTPPAIP